jgi:hypothetical protein
LNAERKSNGCRAILHDKIYGLSVVRSSRPQPVAALAGEAFDVLALLDPLAIVQPPRWRALMACNRLSRADFGHAGSALSIVCFEALASVVLGAVGAEGARGSLRSR